jgi:hypothetical protein
MLLEKKEDSRPKRYKSGAPVGLPTSKNAYMLVYRRKLSFNDSTITLSTSSDTNKTIRHVTELSPALPLPCLPDQLQSIANAFNNELDEDVGRYNKLRDELKASIEKRYEPSYCFIRIWYVRYGDGMEQAATSS